MGAAVACSILLLSVLLPIAIAKEPPDRLTITQNSTGRTFTLTDATAAADAWGAMMVWKQ